MKKIKGFVIVVPFIRIFGINGITLFPFILLKNKKLKEDKRVINHENIHIQQQVELLVIPFFLIYILEWFIKKLMNGRENAYWKISFEKEAHLNDTELDYLEKRKRYASFKYLFK